MLSAVDKGIEAIYFGNFTNDFFVHQPVKEGFGRNSPYIMGVVDLEEGVKAVVRIGGVDARKPELLKIGTPLKAEFLVKEEGGA